MNTDSTLDSAAHLVQVALTPVFLLSGIAALLSVFARRLARGADRMDAIGSGHAPQLEADEIARLHRRSIVLDIAVVPGPMGAAATCLAILTLFLFALSNTAIGNVLVGFFGVAIVCTLISVTAFGLEMLLSSQALRSRMVFHVPHLRWFGGRK